MDDSEKKAILSIDVASSRNPIDRPSPQTMVSEEVTAKAVSGDKLPKQIHQIRNASQQHVFDFPYDHILLTHHPLIYYAHCMLSD